MRAFLDTSVLVAAFYKDHEHHEASFRLLLAQPVSGSGKQTGCTAAHCLAEVYAVLTGMPGKDRATGDEALLFLGDVRHRLKVLELAEGDYVAILERAAAAGVAGGGIYDALLAGCAMKAKAETIYTWNTKHFARIGGDVAARVKSPAWQQ